MDEERVDLSALTPWPGAAFEFAVQRVVKVPTLESVIVRQGRAALVAVAAMALLAWAPAWFVSKGSSSTRAGELVSHWAATGERPANVHSAVGAIE